MYRIIVLFSLILGCKKPFSPKPKTALAAPTEDTTTWPSIAFITGFDKDNNTYYSNAKTYFKAQDLIVIDHLSSLNEIITYLNTSDVSVYKNIHIVSHSNPWLGMALKTTKNGERITKTTLNQNLKAQRISPLCNGINSSTKIIFHACGLAQNSALLRTLKQAFTDGTAPKLIASPFFNVFGGKYAAHYLAKSYYSYYPTAESPGPLAVSKAFKNKYPHTDIDWFRAIKTRQEGAFGAVYSYTFNIPIHWEFTFNNASEIPKLETKDAIMDWIVAVSELSKTLYDLNIPIAQYRWRQRIKDKTLFISGKATVICVLAPILDLNNPYEYKTIAFEDASLYQTL